MRSYHHLINEIKESFNGETDVYIISCIENRFIDLGKRLRILQARGRNKEFLEISESLKQYFDPFIYTYVNDIVKGNHLKNKKAEDVKKKPYTISPANFGRLIRKETKSPDVDTLDKLAILVDYVGWNGFREDVKINDLFMQSNLGLFDLDKKEKSIIKEKEGEELSLLLIRNIIDLKRIRNQSLVDDSNFQKTLKEDVNFLIEKHQVEALSWSSEISMSNLDEAKNIDKIYQHLEYYSPPLQHNDDTIFRKRGVIDFNNYLKNASKNIVILGQPGSGKTTSLKFITNKLLKNRFHEEIKFKNVIVIRFRDFKEVKNRHNTDEIIGESIFFRIFIIFDHIEYDLYLKNKLLIDSIVIMLLNDLKILLILDGFDEYSLIDKKNRIDEIQKLSKSLDKSKFILTSRPSEFPYNIDLTKSYQIANLTPEQIELFSKEWLKNKDEVEDFLSKLEKKTYKDTIERPLVLVHLLIIYDNTDPKELPSEPNKIYDKVIELLIKKWDKERNIERISSYSRFGYKLKKDFLAELSFNLTTKKKNKGITSIVFSRREVNLVYKQISKNYSLPKDECDIVLKELESHGGIFIKVSENFFEFAHKSIQEYLTALHLIKSPYLLESISFNLTRMADELAIFVAISENSNYYFIFIIDSIVINSFELWAEISRYNFLDEKSFLNSFLDRLFLEKVEFEVSFALGLCLARLYTKNFVDINYVSYDFESEINIVNQINVIKKDEAYIDKIFELQNVKESIAFILKFRYFIISPLKIKKNEQEKHNFISDFGNELVIFNQSIVPSIYKVTLLDKQGFVLKIKFLSKWKYFKKHFLIPLTLDEV